MQWAGPVRFSAPRMAHAAIAAVLTLYVVNTLLLVISGGLHGLRLVAFIGCLATAFALQLAHSTGTPLRWPQRTRITTLLLQTAVTFLPFIWVGPQAGAFAGFVAGSVLLAVSRRWRWALYLLIAGGVWVGLRANGLSLGDAGYGFYFTLLTGLMVYAVSSLGALVEMVYTARGELAQLAVVRERLRVARDLHDLLGFHISAMTLKSELAYRLLPTAPDRARRELRDVVAAAHRALAEIRRIAGGDQRMSTVEEVAVARAILAATDMDLRVEVSLPELPVDIDTALAIVLREAATNILRHSKARRCLIEAEVLAGAVQLRVGNDGVEPDSGGPERAGAGLDNLADRVAAFGGQLVTATDAGWFRLTATVPLSPRTTSRLAPSLRLSAEPPAPPRSASRAGTAVGATGSGAAGPGAPDLSVRVPHRKPAPGTVAPWHRRVARTITLVILGGYGLLLFINVLGTHPPVPALLGFAGCMAVVVGIQVLHAFGEPGSWSPWRRAGTMSAQAVFTALPLAWLGEPWGSMGGMLAGSMLLVLTGPVRWVMYAGVGGAVLVLALMVDPGAPVGYLTLSTLVTGLVVYAISSLTGMMRQVEEARQRLARVAVVRERLRVSRDLQDRLGQHLSEMLDRSERAFRELPHSPGPARAELAEMLDVTRRALAEARVVANGYRHMSLAAELRSAESTLAAGGIAVSTDAPDEPELPQQVDALAALVVREAVTNVIRHSDARSATVALDPTPHRLRLRVTNDGVRSTPGTAPWPALPAGSGLGDLAERLRAIGGNLTADTTNGWLRLVAEIPMPPESVRQQAGATPPGILPWG